MKITKRITAIAPVLMVLALFSARAMGAEPDHLILKNGRLTLEFDRQTGGWISLIDHRDGENLIAEDAPRALVLPAAPVKLQTERIRAAIDGQSAIDLAGEWRYAAGRPGSEEAFRQGRFEGVDWQATPVPSRRGVGDDRLHNRTGDFYYRREFDVPKSWGDEPRMLVIGAVDDFDETYLNGKRIGRTGVETPHHWEAPRFYRVPAGWLHRDRPNVLLVKVTNPAFDGGIDGPVVLGSASALAPPKASGPTLERAGFRRSEDGEELTMIVKVPPFEYRMDVCLAAEAPRFTRRLTIRNSSDREVEIENPPATGTPPFNLGAAQTLSFPGSLPVGDTPLAELNDGETLGPRSQEPLVVVWDNVKGRGLGSWYDCDDEFTTVSARRTGLGIELRHAQRLIMRLKAGASVTLGTQYFWLTHGTRDDALRGVQALYRAVGLHAPTDGLPGLREKVLYCGHPGGPPELNYRTYGGFQALERYLPTLQALGVDLLWLLPIWEHGDGAKWNLYAPFDHFQVSRLYGTTDELKRLSAAGGRDGIRLLFDLVPHGPPDFTPLAREHPEWVSRDKAGKPVYEWGQYSFDYAQPGWQDYMRRAAEWDARQFDAVGARVDCAAGGAPNWDPKAGDRPSRSTLAGALAMNRAIRDGFLHAGRAPVLLPEEYTGANLYNRVADLTYDAQLYFLLMDLQDREAKPEEWAEKLQRFLHDQQQTLPPGSLKMRWISNHDTVSWTFQKRRPLAVYGVDRMRALLALCALVEGVPMLYQGDEDPAVYGGKGPSSVDYLGRIYGLRKRIAALREGTAYYDSVRASDGVFACLRDKGGEPALVLISLNPQPVNSRLASGGSIVGQWHDALADERVDIGADVPVQLAPHQVRVLVRPARTK